MELPDKKLKLKESDYVEPGAALAELVDSPVGKIGLGIVSHTIQFYLFFISMIYLWLYDVFLYRVFYWIKNTPGFCIF